MRKFFFAIAAIACAATLSLSTADKAAAAGALNYSKVPGLETLIGPQADAVAFVLYHKYHHGCYRPYICKHKYGHHYKHCYWGHCKHKKHYHKKHHYKKHHYHKRHHHHHKKRYYRKRH